MNKKIMIPIATIAFVGLGMFAASTVYAETQTDPKDPMTTLVQKIADKFGLKQSDVQTVFDQEREARKVKMEEEYESRLTTLVKDGKITEAQKQLILAKHKELETSRQSAMQNEKGKTEEERKKDREANKTKMDTERKELEAWAKQNNIDVQYLMGFGMRGGHGPGPTQ
jgi:hypothetical protein